jgi:GNAT superfamily N-acetyltransferase
LGDLADVLVDAVHGGASVGFVLPFDLEDATAYWRRVLRDVEAGAALLIGSFAGDRVDGTVQLRLEMPPNQPHRAEVAKLLVHRRARSRGLGEALLAAAEAEARRRGRTLLVLDTIAGSDAERLYRHTGWTLAGTVPDYALMPTGSEPRATAIFWKRLAHAD